MRTGVGMLGKFISVREPNIRYLGLENMVRLAEVPAVSEGHQQARKPGFRSHKHRTLASLCSWCCVPLLAEGFVSAAQWTPGWRSSWLL